MPTMGLDHDNINKTTATHIEYSSAEAHLNNLEIVKGAQQAATAEHEVTFWRAIKENRKSVFWSAIISLTIIMEGYDVGMTHQEVSWRIDDNKDRPDLPVLCIPSLPTNIWKATTRRWLSSHRTMASWAFKRR